MRRLIGLRLHGKRMGRSDRADANFYREGYLLEDFAGTISVATASFSPIPAARLSSLCFVWVIAGGCRESLRS